MKFKKCTSCGEEMDIIRVFLLGQLPEEFQACPKCHEPELRRFSPTGNYSTLKFWPKGAYGIG